MMMDIIALIGILIMLIILPLGIVIYYRRKLTNISIQLNDVIENINIEPQETPTMSEMERLTYNKELLLFIDELVVNELMSTKRKELFLDKERKDIDFDNVIKTVATSVFEGVKPEIFKSPENMLTSEYILKYIAKRTTLSYLKYLEDRVAHTI